MDDEKMLKTEQAPEEDEAYKKAKRKELKLTFTLVSLGICLAYAGYSAFLGLQTSINIEDGTGSIVTFFAYINAIAVCFLVPANLVRFLGVKYSMILSESCFVIYLIGNLVPNRTVLQVVAIIAGFGDAILWVPMGLLISYFSKEYSKVAPNLNEESCYSLMSGILFPLFQFNNLLGNLIVFAVLEISSLLDTASAGNMTSHQNTTSSPPPVDTVTSSYGGGYDVDDNIRFCAAADCQDVNVTSSNLDRYVPPRSSIIVFVICLISIQIVGIFLHCKYIPRFYLCDVNRDEHEKNDSKLKSPRQLVTPILKTFKLFFFNINQWLMFIPGFYFGLIVGFLFSEVTRAYAACTLGVSSISMFVIVHSVVYIFFSWLWSRLIMHKGKMLAMVLRPVLDTILLLTCLLWEPSHSNALLAVGSIFLIMSVCISGNQILVSMFYSLIFPNNLEISYIFWNITFYAGWSTQFGWSLLLCVNYKIYIMLAILVLASASFQILNYRLNKEERRNQERLRMQIQS